MERHFTEDTTALGLDIREGMETERAANDGDVSELERDHMCWAGRQRACRQDTRDGIRHCVCERKPGRTLSDSKDIEDAMSAEDGRV